jgi:hypothetical protein
MAKVKLPKGSTTNGGIGNSGIFGFFGTTVNCDANSNSIYCNSMKLFNLFIVLLIVMYIFYTLYGMLKSKK